MTLQLKTTDNPLISLSQAQRERLAYLEFRLLFLGDIRRQDLMDRFGIAPAASTRDFTLYKGFCPDNISFEGRSKRYMLGTNFVPLFQHPIERVLMMLSQGFGDGIAPIQEEGLLPCELPLTLNRPDIHILAPVTRSIYQQKAVKIRYLSRTSGLSEREIVPFALANDGLRWHVRAFDRKSREFRDFVFTRMESTELLDSNPAKHELPAQDIQWNRIVELDIVPHPDRERPKITERDYGMVDGVLHLKLRAAMAGYVLRQWQVDCSADHRIKEQGCRLWLRDALALYGVKNAMLALGYQTSANDQSNIEEAN